jgi:hypothetical protein
MLKILGKRLAILWLCLLSAACAPTAPSTVNTFLLCGDESNLEAVSSRVVHALASPLKAERNLESPYPQAGRLMMQPDPSQANAQLMPCAQAGSQGAHEEDRILLDRAGDFGGCNPSPGRARISTCTGSTSLLG